MAKNIREPEVKAKEAIGQIKDRNYMKEWNDNGYEIVHKYGTVFGERIVRSCMRVREWVM